MKIRKNKIKKIISKNNMKKVETAFVICILSAVLCCSGRVYANEDLISQTKQGIVEIYSGFYSKDGRFHQIKNASGFLIHNQGGQAYIATVSHALKSTEKEKKKYCKKNELTYEENGLRDTIQVVVKGDIMIEAAVVAESEIEDYSILKVQDQISKKTAVQLGSAEDVSIGDRIYALGFEENAEENEGNGNGYTNFSAMDVVIKAGDIQDADAYRNGVRYLQHSAPVTRANAGGPLLNEQGYVIGLNLDEWGTDGTNMYGSLPIDTIRDTLDNFGIAYLSSDRMQAFDDFSELADSMGKLLEDETYSEESKEMLRKAVDDAKNLALDENTDMDAVDEIAVRLKEGRESLELKLMYIPQVQAAAVGAAVCLVIGGAAAFFIWKQKSGRKSARRGTENGADGYKEQASGRRRADAGRKRRTDSWAEVVNAGRKQMPGGCTDDEETVLKNHSRYQNSHQKQAEDTMMLLNDTERNSQTHQKQAGDTMMLLDNTERNSQGHQNHPDETMMLLNGTEISSVTDQSPHQNHPDETMMLLNGTEISSAAGQRLRRNHPDETVMIVERSDIGGPRQQYEQQTGDAGRRDAFLQQKGRKNGIRPYFQYSGTDAGAGLPQRIEVYMSENKRFTIGRFDVVLGSKQSDFEFEKSTKGVSRHHAVIEKLGEKYAVCDLNSSAGTYVNGNRLKPGQLAVLQSGDRVSFGYDGADYIWKSR